MKGYGYLMNLDHLLLEKITNISWQNFIQAQDHRILSGCIAMYQQTGNLIYKEIVADYVNRNLELTKIEGFTFGKALCFLYEETKEEKYKEKVRELVSQLNTFSRKNGILVSCDGEDYSSNEVDMLLPTYAWYETNFNRKQNYYDIMTQLDYIHKQGIENDIFLMTLADMLFIMSEEIYEFYAKIRDWLKEGIQIAISRGKEDIKVGYAILRGCQSKAILPEKYEEIGKNLVRIKAKSFFDLEKAGLSLNDFGVFLMSYVYL